MKTRWRPPVLAACFAVGLLSLASSARAGAPAGRYTVDSVSGTVFDNETGLMWERGAPSNTYTWLGALAYCEGLIHAGHSDWRLPNLKELHTIVDWSTSNPAIDIAAFPGTPSEFFWSSTPWASNLGNAEGVNFSVGCAAAGSTQGFGRVRCVR